MVFVKLKRQRELRERIDPKVIFSRLLTWALAQTRLLGDCEQEKLVERNNADYQKKGTGGGSGSSFMSNGQSFG